MQRLRKQKILLLLFCCAILLALSLSRLFSLSFLNTWLPGLELTPSVTLIHLLLLSSALLSMALELPRQVPVFIGFSILLSLALLPLVDDFWSTQLLSPSPADVSMTALLGTAVILSQHVSALVRHIGEYFAGLCLALALASMLVFAAGTESLNLSAPIRTSFYTAMIVGLIGLITLTLIQGGAARELLYDRGMAGRFSRRLIILVLLLLVGLALLANPSVGTAVFSGSSDLILLFGLFLALMLIIIFTLGHKFRVETVESSTLEKRLHESTTHLESVLEIAPIGVLTVNQSGVIYSANRAAEDIFGATHGAMSGINVDTLVPAQLGQWHASHREYYDANPQTRKMGATRELKAVRLDGTEIDVEIFLSPVLIDQVSMMVLSVSDITARVRLTQELLKARDELQHKVDHRTQELQHSYDQLLKKNLQLQQFTYAASHDLQTPLRGIGVYAGALKEDYAQVLDSQAVAYIDFVVKEAQRLQRLINDLLEYARLDHSAVGAFTRVDLNSIIDETEVILHSAFGKTGFSLEREKLLPLHGNSSMIAQLFYNLIDNGIKYRGTEQPRITISHSMCENGMVEVAVRDNGMGIESIHHARIFEIFRRLHTQEEFPGTGIGLAICKRIVENHGGSIHLSSEPGAGSTFYIRMPVHVEQEVEGECDV